jgi:hypothetical protein
MGNPMEALIKNGLGVNEHELIRSFAEYSYVLKAKDIHSMRDLENVVAEVELFPGSWIVFAKSTLRAPGGDGIVDVQWVLSATENSAAQTTAQLDRAKASTTNGHYSTVSLLLGAHFKTGGKVKLTASASGINRSGELVDTVIATVKIDKLLVWDL